MITKWSKCSWNLLFSSLESRFAFHLKLSIRVMLIITRNALLRVGTIPKYCTWRHPYIVHIIVCTDTVLCFSLITYTVEIGKRFGRYSGPIPSQGIGAQADAGATLFERFTYHQVERISGMDKNLCIRVYEYTIIYRYDNTDLYRYNDILFCITVSIFNN